MTLTVLESTAQLFCSVSLFGFVWCFVISWASQVAMVVENLSANAGDERDMDSVPGSGGSPREGNGNRSQYSCLENPRTRGVWQATVHGVAESDVTEHPGNQHWICVLTL